MRCSHCGKCCEETEMELSREDIKILEERGYRQKEFAIMGEDGVMRLRNVGKWCYFYDAVEKLCKIYANRPLGCYIYPVVYSIHEGFITDDLCPMTETISEQEFWIKRRILIKLLKANGIVK